MSTLLFALLVPSAQAEPRIVNGQVAQAGEFPEVVGVSVGGGTCTGSLINRRWVLTAAHCFDSISVESSPTGGATVQFGLTIDAPDREVAAERVIVHPEYVSLGTSSNGLGTVDEVDGYENSTNDIALIRLAEDVDGTVMAINSAPIDQDWIGRGTTHIGFGLTESDAGDSGTKRFATGVPVTDYSLEHTLDAPDNNGAVVFFDSQGGRSGCQGDSGGPSIFYQGDGYAQIGVTAFGGINCGTSPFTHMRADLYIDWIEENAGITLVKEYIRPSTFQCSHQLNPGAADSIAIGVAPFELQCIVDSGDPQNITEVSWFWGDGSPTEVRTDLVADHTYDTMGVYNLRACITGDRVGNPFQDCVLRSSHVNVCSEPVPSFEATPLEGLRIDLRNSTSLRAHNCVSNAEWQVFAGSEATGEPLFTLSSWEPEIFLEDEGPGTYTVVLSVGGLGGTGAASATVEVGRGTGCSTAGAWPMMAPLALLPLFGLRRRR